jgi:hypothetical protein
MSDHAVIRNQRRSIRYLSGCLKELGSDKGFMLNEWGKMMKIWGYMGKFHESRMKYVLEVVLEPLPGRKFCLLGYNSLESRGKHA